jgi:hypothetical protein
VSEIQYQVVFAKKDVVTEGPDDAGLTIEVAVADAGLDPTVAYMQGKLRATGDTGVLFTALASGAVAEAVTRLSQRA